MDLNLEETIMNLVANSGEARSTAMEAIAFARKGDFEAAGKAMKSCEEQLSKAHRMQTELIQQEAKGRTVPLSLLMVHAQDHLMTAGVVRDLAKEIVALHEKICCKGD